MSELIQNVMPGLIEPAGMVNRTRNATTVPAALPHSAEAFVGPQLIQLLVPGTRPHGCDPTRYAGSHTGFTFPVKCHAPVVEMPEFHATTSSDQSVDESTLPAVPVPPRIDSVCVGGVMSPRNQIAIVAGVAWLALPPGS